MTDTCPTTLDDVVEAVGGAGNHSPDADRRLRWLLAVARIDDLAGRVVIERLTPGLLAISRRYRRDPDAFEELLAAAWIAIRTYSATRSPNRIAVALLSDAVESAYRRPARRRSGTERPVDFADHLPARSTPDPLVELAELVADARSAGMSNADIDLVLRLVQNPRTEDVAHDLDVTSRTVRNRRERVARRLREIAVAA